MKKIMSFALLLSCFFCFPIAGLAIVDRNPKINVDFERVSTKMTDEKSEADRNGLFEQLQQFFSPLLLDDVLQKGVNQSHDDVWSSDFLTEITKDFKDDRLNQVLQKCRLILDQYPDLWFPHFMLALTYNNTGDLEKSLQEIEKTLSLNPDLVQAKLWKALICLQKGEPEPAQRFVVEVLDQHPGHPEALLMEAQLKQFHHQYDQAIAVCNEILGA